MTHCWPHSPELAKENRRVGKAKQEAKEAAAVKACPPRKPGFTLEACSCEEAESLKAVLRLIQAIASGEKKPPAGYAEGYSELGQALAIANLAEMTLERRCPKRAGYPKLRDFRNEQVQDQALMWVLENT